MFGVNDGQKAQDSPFPPAHMPQEAADGPMAQQANTTQTPLPDELLDIKQQALQSLTPLVHTLDQSPEEKFKTTMMLIQASDNAKLIKDAYTAASQIQDEKIRAQALIDIINEINYFTHKND